MTALAESTAAYSRSMYIAYAPLTVACGYCRQPRGWECRSKTGNRPLAFHAARVRAVAHLSDDERYEVFDAFRAEADEQRRQSEAAFAALEADPEYIAVRDATRTAINNAWEIDRKVRAEERSARLSRRSHR